MAFTVHEFVQASGILEYFHPRAQVQVIGISQNDLRLDIVPQAVLFHGLHTSDRAHWHKDRGLNFAVIRLDTPRARAGAGIGMFECEF